MSGSIWAWPSTSDFSTYSKVPFCSKASNSLSAAFLNSIECSCLSICFHDIGKGGRVSRCGGFMLCPALVAVANEEWYPPSSLFLPRAIAYAAFLDAVRTREPSTMLFGLNSPDISFALLPGPAGRASSSMSLDDADGVDLMLRVVEGV